MRTVSDLLMSKAVTFNDVEYGTLVIDALQMLNSVNLSYLVVKKGEEFIEELRGLWADGLDTGRYRIAHLSETMNKLDKQKGDVATADVITYDTLFSNT